MIFLQATVEDLQQAFAAAKPRYPVNRQRFTLPARDGSTRAGEALNVGKRLIDYGIKDGSVLFFKDLGTQVGYRTVFVWEYLGPFVIYPIFYFLPALFYSMKAPEKNIVQTLAMAYWCFHYGKRIAETLFVHQFSHGTMPIRNLFKNCSYYWLFAGYISYFINHPLYTSPSEQRALLALGFSMLCQMGNLRCHVILAGLRPPGSKAYEMPRGFLFDYITCANYTLEILGWVGFSIATQCLPALLFTVAGAVQMAQWAAGKHRRLRKTFDGREGRPKYPRRWIMLPPFF